MRYVYTRVPIDNKFLQVADTGVARILVRRNKNNRQMSLPKDIGHAANEYIMYYRNDIIIGFSF